MKRVVCVVLILAGMSWAHFEMLIPEEVRVSGAGVEIVNIFGHPFESNYLMKSGQAKDGTVLGLKEVFYVHHGDKTDLTDKVTKETYHLDESKAPGYRFTVPTKGMGDYAVFIVPHPYWEEAEDLYIQQITKILLNKSGMPTDWHRRCAPGYTEIVPLVDPYKIRPGTLFRARVLDSDGKPAVNKIVEIEYLNSDVDVKKRTVINRSDDGGVTDERIGTNTLITDEKGMISFIPTEEGYWGFAALGAGSSKKYKGKELEQDPVLWIEVK
ncbi:MAG: DUF4198 domain-containing protein [Fibrobacterota bacterium]